MFLQNPPCRRLRIKIKELTTLIKSEQKDKKKINLDRILATRRGTAATRPRVKMVGKVRNLELWFISLTDTIIILSVTPISLARPQTPNPCSSSHQMDLHNFTYLLFHTFLIYQLSHTLLILSIYNYISIYIHPYQKYVYI